LTGAGCKQTAVQPKADAETAASVEATSNEIINGVSDEATQADAVEEEADNLNATDPALDNLSSEKYELQ